MTRRKHCEKNLDSECFPGKGNSKGKCCAVGMRSACSGRGRLGFIKLELVREKRRGLCPAEH